MMDIRKVADDIEGADGEWKFMNISSYSDGYCLVFVNGSGVSLRCGTNNGRWVARWRDFETSQHNSAADALRFLRSEIRSETERALKI